MPRPKFRRPRCLSQLEVIGLDFETYFDKDYSLRKQNMSTSLYVRDERFQVQGVSIQHERWKRPRWYNRHKAERELRAIDWEGTAVLAHHTHFDGFILTDHYGLIPAYYLCSLSMARGLHSSEIGANLDEVARLYGKRNKLPDVLEQTKGIRELPPELDKALGEYACVDVAIMWEVFCEMLPQMPEQQLDVINMIVSMFCEPQLMVDRPRAAAELRRELAERKELLLKAVPKKVRQQYWQFAESKFRKKDLPITDEQVALKVLNSDQTFSELLERRGIEVPMKWSEKKEKAVPAFAKDDLDFQELGKTKRGKDLYNARLAAKSTNQIAKAGGLLKRTVGGKPLPVYVNYYGAHTGRKSGGDKINPQNFKRGSELRKSLRAPKGWHVVAVDASQIEARSAAYVAGQQDLLDAFADPKRDPYCEFASDFYGFTVIKDVHDLERFVGKTCVLGLQYQMAGPKFQYTLEVGTMGPPVVITLKEANQAVALYRSKNKHIVALWGLLQKLIFSALIKGHPFELKDGLFHFEKGRILKPSGMYLKYPNLRQEHDPDTGRSQFVYDNKGEPTNLYGGKQLENIIQGWCADMTDTWSLELERDFPIVMQTHDEVVFLAREHEVEEAAEHACKIMRTPPPEAPDLPLDAEAKHAEFYAK